MTVEQFEKKYNALQKESKELLAEIKPLLSRLKRISNRCGNLRWKADIDMSLYKVESSRLPDGRMGSDYQPDGWDISILFRLADMVDLQDCFCSIDNTIYNLLHTNFRKNKFWH